MKLRQGALMIFEVNTTYLVRSDFPPCLIQRLKLRFKWYLSKSLDYFLPLTKLQTASPRYLTLGVGQF